MKIDHISKSVYWNIQKNFAWFIFWGIFLDPIDHLYKALTFTYRFDKLENETKDECYARGWQYISTMLSLHRAYEFTQNFNPETEIIVTHNIFAVAPYDADLDGAWREQGMEKMYG